MLPKLSIITVCYNEPNLRDTCESIVQQSFQNFEWIVIDGGSNKQTLDVFEQYRYRIDTFVSEPDKGIYDAMNKGIQLASADEERYLLFMNAGDCFYQDSTLERIFAYDITEDVIYCNAYMKLEKEYVRFPDKLDLSFWFFRTINHQASFIKLRLFEQYGLYDTQYKIAADYERWLCFFYRYHCTFRHVKEVCTIFDGTGISSQPKNRDLRALESKMIKQKYIPHKTLEEKLFYQKYTLFEWIFSIKSSPDRDYRIITILGIHVKIKRKNKGKNYR